MAPPVRFSPEHLERLQQAAREVGRRLPTLEEQTSPEVTVWFGRVDEVFGPFYEALYGILMDPREPIQMGAPPLLDNLAHAAYAEDVLELQAAITALTDVLSDPAALREARQEFPKGAVGEVCFTLGRVLLHLSDFEFPTMARLPGGGRELTLRLDGDLAQLQR